MTQPIQKVVIVGGGTAGWLTAGIIAARHQGRMKAGFTVTVVESPNIPIIGVGEGTWPTLRSSLEKMGISETEFFRHSDAAFKQGAKFARWTTGAVDDYYYHPLMLPQGFTQLNLVPHWLSSTQSRNFSDSVCPQPASRIAMASIPLTRRAPPRRVISDTLSAAATGPVRPRWRHPG